MNLADARHRLGVARCSSEHWCEMCDHACSPDEDLVALAEELIEELERTAVRT